MEAKEWLAIVAASMPGVPSPSRTSAMRQFAPRIAAEISPHALTRDNAAAIGGSLTGFPTIDQLIHAIRSSSADVAAPRHRSEQDIADDGWISYVARRLGEGAPRGHLLSLARAYASPSAVRAIMERHFPRELADQEEEEERRRHDRSRSLRMPNLRHIAAAPGRAGSVTTLPPARPEPRAHYLSGEALEVSRRARGIAPRPDAAG